MELLPHGRSTNTGLTLDKLFLEVDQIDFRFLFRVFCKLTFSLRTVQCRHNLANLPDLQLGEIEQQHNQFVSNYVCRKDSIEPLSAKTCIHASNDFRGKDEIWFWIFCYFSK